MNKINKWLVACAAAVSSTLALAEGTTPTVDLSAAGDAADAIGTALSGLLTGKVMSNVLTVVAAGLAIWAVFFVLRYIKRGSRQ